MLNYKSADTKFFTVFCFPLKIFGIKLLDYFHIFHGAFPLFHILFKSSTSL